jgi:predicted alpha/beta hydrolase family esterase
VISYDYSGIGKSTGVFNEQEMYNDVEEMSAFIDEMNIPRNNIFVLGHSLGCLASFHYATTFKDCCGLVLVNLVSFEDLRKISNVKSKYNFNDLETKKLFQELHCPTFIIHAKEDEMELEENTNKLCKTLENCKSWFPNNCGHLNLFVNKRKAFIYKVKDFLYTVAKDKGETPGNEQDKKKKNLEHSLAEGNKSTVEDDSIKKIDDVEIEKMRNGDNDEDSGHGSFVDEEEMERNMKMEKELEAEYQY